MLPAVGVAEIEAIVSGWTRIPVDRLSQEDSDRLMRLQDVLTVRLQGWRLRRENPEALMPHNLSPWSLVRAFTASKPRRF